MALKWQKFNKYFDDSKDTYVYRRIVEGLKSQI